MNFFDGLPFGSGCRCLNANIRLKKINGLTQQNLFHQAVYSVVFFDFFAHFFHRNIVMRSLLPDPLLHFLGRDLNFLRLGNAMENEIRFQAMRCQRSGAFDQLLLLAFQHFIRHAALTISLHQFTQGAPGFISQKLRRQIELGLLLQSLYDLRFLRPLDGMLLLVLEIVRHQSAAIPPAFCPSSILPRKHRLIPATPFV